MWLERGGSWDLDESWGFGEGCRYETLTAMTRTVVSLLIFPSLGLFSLSQHFPFRELGQETQVEMAMLWASYS